MRPWGRRGFALAATTFTTLGVVPAQAGLIASPRSAQAVVAVVAERGINALHHEYRTRDGRDATLPRGIAADVISVSVPFRASFAAQVAALERSPLKHPQLGATYYVRGTRLLIHIAEGAPSNIRTDAFHGTGTSSLAAGRTVGAAPDALVVVVLGHQNSSWAWLAEQSWVDVATQSTFVLGPCDSVAEVHAFRAAGHLAFVAAGNSYVDTTAISPGGSPDVLRVGGVDSTGASVLPGNSKDPTFYSGRAYDTAGLLSNRIADGSSANGYTTGDGTSGSSPQVAGRVALVLQTVRAAVGDTGVGVRRGALVVAPAGRGPRSGPLADGVLTADELTMVVLNSSRPKNPPSPARYAIEGYGWFSPAAARTAIAQILGHAAASSRTDDDTAYTAAMTGRRAAYVTNSCVLY